VLTIDSVVWAYRILLDRNPENEAMVLGTLAQYTNISELKRGILASPEFYWKNPDAFTYASEWYVVIKDIYSGLRLCVG
jgi:hypothetical protein